MSSESNYPKYISDYGHAEISYELPGVMKNTRAYMFAFPGTPATMQALVDEFLNAPAKGAVEYSVIGDQAFLTFLHVDHLTSDVELMGWTTDNECGVWIPLLARGGGMDRLVIWMPYIVIDWQEGMVTGREVLGYRKTMGEVVIPLKDADPAHFEVKTTVFPTFARNTQQVTESIIRVQREGTVGALKSEWNEIKEVASAFTHLWTKGFGQLHAHRWQIAIDLVKLAFELEIPIVNLKQFRAAHDTTLACYQAIIECGIGIHGFHGGGLMPTNYQLDITSAASHRIAEDLGLKVPLAADFALWLDLDLSADPGREVVRA
jgi:hypothetical protein